MDLNPRGTVPYPVVDVLLDPARPAVAELLRLDPLEEPLQRTNIASTRLHEQLGDCLRPLTHENDKRAHRVRDKHRLLAVDVEVELNLRLEAREVLVAGLGKKEGEREVSSSAHKRRARTATYLEVVVGKTPVVREEMHVVVVVIEHGEVCKAAAAKSGLVQRRQTWRMRLLSMTLPQIQYPGMKEVAASSPWAARTTRGGQAEVQLTLRELAVDRASHLPLYPTGSTPVNSSRLMALTQVSFELTMARSIAVEAQIRLRKKGAASGVVLHDSRPYEERSGVSCEVDLERWSTTYTGNDARDDEDSVLLAEPSRGRFPTDNEVCALRLEPFTAHKECQFDALMLSERDKPTGQV